VTASSSSLSFVSQHPDKAGDDADATKRFQALCVIHTILSDPGKRGDYDRTGEIPGLKGDDGEIDEEAFAHWYDYWRAQFPPITEEDVKDFESKYRHSAEEKRDVIKAYNDEKGDMDAMLTVVMCSNDEDADRFAAIIHEAIAAKKVKPYAAFTKLYGATPEEGKSAKCKAARGKAAKERKEATSAEARQADELLADLKKKYKEDQEEKKKAGAAGAIVVHTGKKASGAAAAGGGAGGKGKASSAAAAHDDDEEAEEQVSGRKRKQPSTSSSSSSSGAGTGAGGKKKSSSSKDDGAGGYDGEPSLADLIRFQSRQRSGAFESMMEDLEARYASKGKGGKKGKAGSKKGHDDDDEDEDSMDA
jgi:DnaJ homolog subfamily C member 9